MATEAIQVVRETLVARLRASSALTTLLGGAERIIHRYARRTLEANLLTYFDFGSRPDATVPLRDWTFQLDAWTTTLAEGAEIMKAVEDVLDVRGGLGVLPGDVVKVDYLGLTGGRDEPVEDGDLSHSIRTFRVLAYRLN